MRWWTAKVLLFNKHLQCKDAEKHTHGATWLSYSMGALISSEQTPRVMGMFPGCYLVLCGNEITSNLYHHPQTLEDPWPLLEQGPLGCQGTLTNWMSGERDCEGIVRAASGMTDRRLGEDLWLSRLTLPKNSTSCLEVLDFAVAIWTEWDEISNMRTSSDLTPY